jgi:hypothetical protein
MKIQYSIFILLFLISCTAKTGKINQYAKDNNGVNREMAFGKKLILILEN